MFNIKALSKAIVFVATLTLLSACQTPLSNEAADQVYTNGRIYLGNVDNPWASSIAIKAGRFLHAGNNASDHISARTKVIDLEGRTVIPGIIDPHSHPGFVALSHKILAMEETTSKKQLMANIEKLVEDNPEQDVIIGGFWENSLFGPEGPHKSELDAIESDRPIILYDAWAHSVWANTKALQQAGVNAATEDFVPGFSFYQKDEHGEPTGWITESAASVFINNFQSVTPAVENVLFEYLDYYRTIGVTTVLDAGNFGLDHQVYEAVSKLDQQGRLPVNYHGAYTLFLPSEGDTAVDSLKELAAKFNSDRVKIDTLKIFYDGVLETRTAALADDYLDTPGNNGEILLSQDNVHKIIVQLDAEDGLNLHMHAVGDRATTTLLNAVEDAHKTLGRAPDIRMTICHLEVVNNNDFPRFKQLGVIANFTPHWHTGGIDVMQDAIGERALNMQRAQTLIADGAMVTFSSDITDAYEWKTDRANPYLGMQVGHNRQDVGVAADGVYLPPISDRLSRTDLMNGYTSNAAHQLGIEDQTGTIAAGKRADFIVLNQNIFEVDRFDIHKTQPVAVIVGGETVSGGL
ncbi:MAG: amidohydrolase [Pseudomonadales bacterium]